MAGVTAHNRAIVSSANARVLVTLISVRFLSTTNKLLPITMLDRPRDGRSDGDHSPKGVTGTIPSKLFHATVKYSQCLPVVQ